jgi:short-subunit dehydrogenase
MRELRGRVALVTGGSRGLGRRIALELARHGTHVVVVARGVEALGAAAAEVEAAGVEALAVSADLTDPDDRRGVVDQARERFGRIDVLVNNAATVRAVRFLDEEPERLYRTNLLAPVALTRLVLPEMLERGEGHVLAVASIAATVGVPHLTNYAASKAALLAFSHSLRAELHGTGVSATAVCPGFIADDGAYVPYATPTPWYLGSTTTERVARAAVRALLHDRADVVVNGRPVRPLALLERGAPRVAQAVLDRLGLASFTGALAAKQLPYSS